VTQLTKHKRFKRSFKLSKNDVPVDEAVQADCSTTVICLNMALLRDLYGVVLISMQVSIYLF